MNNIEFDYNKQIKLEYKNISKRYRPDFVIKSDLINIIIEVDENQHGRYTNEEEFERMKAVYKSFNTKIAIIRFNPDKYNNKETSLNKRLPILLNFINELINSPDDDNNQLYYMFYDCQCTIECCSIHRYKFVLE